MRVHAVVVASIQNLEYFFCRNSGVSALVRAILSGNKIDETHVL